MEENLFCNKHVDNFAEHYCEECNEFICPFCALSNNHINHINKIKAVEEIIKQIIGNIDEIKNFSIYKTIELFHFIINYNSLYNPINKSNILTLIASQFDEYIGKIIEIKMKIINSFSKEFKIISNTYKEIKKSVLETQEKFLLKITENNEENKNEYLEKLNVCLEKVRVNKNQNEAIKFLEEYSNLINDCFESEDDLNKKYNFYLAYKYLNDNLLNFKDKFFNKMIQPFLEKSSNQLEELIKNINIEEKKDQEKIKSKLDELNTELSNKNKKNNIINIKKELKNDKKEEIKIMRNNNININDNIQKNNIVDKIKSLEENHIKKKEENILKENKEEKKYQENEKEIKIEERIKEENLKEENILRENNEEKEIQENKKEIKIEENINEENLKEGNDNKEEVINNNQNLIEEENKENERKEKEEIKDQSENEFNNINISKNNNSNIDFEPPEIEGGNIDEEEINNLKEDEEAQFLRKESNLEEDINVSNLENAEVENVKKILNDLDEDRLVDQYYEGIKFSDDEKAELNDNAYLEDEEKKDKVNENEQNITKDKEIMDEDINKKDEIQEKKEGNKKENENEKKKKKNTDLNALFGVDVSKKSKNQQKEKEEEDTIKKLTSLNLETWVNIDSVQEDIQKKDNKNLDKRNKRKTISKNPSNFRNLFGVSVNDANNIKQNKNEKEEKKDTINEIPNLEEMDIEKEKEIAYEEPKIPAPKNKDSLEKFNKIYEIIGKEGKDDKKFIELFNSLTWEEKNYIEIIGLKQSDSKVFVYNQILDKVDCFDVKIKFPSLQSYVNVPPYVYFSGGKIDNKPIALIRRLRKINNQFKIEEIGKLKEARSQHTTIYIKYLNSLLFISGTKTKACEKLNLINKKVENFPSLNVGREKCGACLTNNEDLYIFFGFDKNKQKFESTIEKINIINQKKWSIFSISDDQQLIKRYSMSCIPFNFTNKQGIIVVGGVGNLRNDLDDTIFLELDKNNVKRFNIMPIGSSFTNPNFLSLTLGAQPKYIYNITNENKIISFNLESYQFSGIE